eukprot:4873453-Amphidinium_carterae.1
MTAQQFGQKVVDVPGYMVRCRTTLPCRVVYNGHAFALLTSHRPLVLELEHMIPQFRFEATMGDRVRSLRDASVAHNPGHWKVIACNQPSCKHCRDFYSLVLACATSESEH